MIPVHKQKFRNSMNRCLTKGLFYETAYYSDRNHAVYTLKNWDIEEEGQKYPSLYKLYMDSKDLTEYTFATEYLDSWYHWEELLKCTWFQPYITLWRQELEIKTKAEALRSVIEASKGQGKDSLAAARFILSYVPPKAGKGRPSKEAIKKAATEMAEVEKQINNDYERLVLN